MGISFEGNVRIIHTDANGVVISDHTAQNTVTSGGLALIAEYLRAGINTAAPIPPRRIAIGSGTVPVGRFLTAVPGETFRTMVDNRSREWGAVTYYAHLQDSDNANQTVGCYGLIAGRAGPTQSNLGPDPLLNEILFAVANEPTPYNKGGAATVSIDWTITASGVL